MKPHAPAYPHAEYNGDGTHYHDHHGLTKRELFAAMAMQGLASVPVVGGDDPSVLADWDAKRAVLYADALLAALDTE